MGTRETLLDMVGSWVGESLTHESRGFLEWEAKDDRSELRAPDSCQHPPNVFCHDGPEGSIEIQVSTIHGVKGETHAATLVLETYLNRKYDLRVLLPFLAGNGDREQLSKSPELRGHMKRVFVGMTRPTDLVCLALHEGHLSEGDLEALQAFGWQVDDLTVVEEKR
ncbi:MAG: hypothetical protein HQ592_01720 [Planctomycetes bacterium]|nr:hypothetical protein [Planctomycetota bacterium]